MNWIQKEAPLGIGVAVVLAASAAGCEIQFTPEVTPLIIASSGPSSSAESLGTTEPDLDALPAGTTTPGAVPGPQQAVLLAGCGLDGIGLVGSAIKTVSDAENAAGSLVEFYDRTVDAGYNFCRMEGGTDDECR